jgi:hypothetical protein
MKSCLEQKRQRDKKPLVGATVHRNFDRLLRIWPNARFIHIIRDPRDVARSIVQMGWAGNVWSAVDTWIEAETLWDKLRQQLTPDRCIEVRFEDLVNRPAAELARLCDFIGVRYTPQMFSYAATSTYSLPDKRMAQSWRSSMPSKDVQLVEHKAARLIQERGYERSGLPELDMGRIRQRLLAFHSRAKKFAFRLKRYGVTLTLGDVLSRRLKLESVQVRLRSTLNEIDLLYLK